MSRFFTFMKRMYERYIEEEVRSTAGELSYFIILSLFPLIFVLLQVVSYLPIDHALLMNYLHDYVPAEAIWLIDTFVSQIVNQSSRGFLSFGIIGMLWTSSRGSQAIIRSMNRAYHVEETRPFWKVALLSFLIIVGIIFMIIFSLLITIFGERILNLLYSIFEISLFNSHASWNFFRGIGTFLVLFLGFVIAYRIIPSTPLTIKQILPGATFTTVGWVGASFLFFFYVENVANYSATYGSIGGVIVLMTWIYLSCTVMIIGGILNSQLSRGQEKVEK